MSKKLKVGDLVEDCSLMPGVVMAIEEEHDDICIRRLDIDVYTGSDFSHCSLNHCGIIKINSSQVLYRLALGRKRLEQIWESMNDLPDEIEDCSSEYSRRVEEAFKNDFLK